MSRTPGVRPRAVSKTSIADVDHSDCELFLYFVEHHEFNLSPASRASSALSQPDCKYSAPLLDVMGLTFSLVNQKDTKEQVHLREREWGKRHPPPKTPESHRHSYSHESHSSGGSKGGSPMLNLTNRPARRDSITSLKSMDDNLSSRGSSVGSQADCE